MQDCVEQKKTRAKIKQLGMVRLCVHRTSQHICVQLINAEGKVLAAAGTVQKELRQKIKSTSNIDAAKEVGKKIAAEIKKLKIDKIAFDRAGYKYHGRVKALADAVRESGIQF